MFRIKNDRGEWRDEKLKMWRIGNVFYKNIREKEKVIEIGWRIMIEKKKKNNMKWKNKKDRV